MSRAIKLISEIPPGAVPKMAVRRSIPNQREIKNPDRTPVLTAITVHTRAGRHRSLRASNVSAVSLLPKRIPSITCRTKRIPGGGVGIGMAPQTLTKRLPPSSLLELLLAASA
jgi:hypothetical protein